MKTWQYIDLNECCDDCGNELEVCTDAPGLACYDGDRIRCVECGLGGYVTVDEDGDTLVHFDGELLIKPKAGETRFKKK